MDTFDFFTYYPVDDLLVVYTFEDNTLREDSIYGFENCTKNMDTNVYFWSVDWHGIKSIVHRVLVTDYTLPEYKERFTNNEQFFGMNYEEQYTVQDVLDQLVQYEVESEDVYYY